MKNGGFDDNEERVKLDLAPMSAATAVVSLGPVQPGGSGGVVNVEGRLLSALKDLA